MQRRAPWRLRPQETSGMIRTAPIPRPIKTAPKLAVPRPLRALAKGIKGAQAALAMPVEKKNTRVDSRAAGRGSAVVVLNPARPLPIVARGFGPRAYPIGRRSG